jgi:hypothetical protein
MGDPRLFHQADKRLLQLQCNGVIHAAEIKDIDNTKVHTLIVAIGKKHLPRREGRKGKPQFTAECAESAEEVAEHSKIQELG